jgi:hypothetical protein
MKFNCQSIATTLEWRTSSVFPILGQTKTQESACRRGGLGAGTPYRNRSLRRGARVLRLALQVAFSIASLMLPMRLEAQVPHRADLLREERAAMTQEIRPPQRTNIERGMVIIQKASERFNCVRGDGNGLHYSSGYFPASSRFGFGVGYTVFSGGRPLPERLPPVRS